MNAKVHATLIAALSTVRIIPAIMAAPSKNSAMIVTVVFVISNLNERAITLKSPQDFPQVYSDAVRNKNVEAFAHLYSEDARIFDMWDEWSMSGREACRNMAKEWFSSLGSEHVVVTFSDVEYTASSDLASMICFVRFAAHDEKDTLLRFLDERMTVIFRKTKSDPWEVIHQHTSAPVESQKMSVKMHRSLG